MSSKPVKAAASSPLTSAIRAAAAEQKRQQDEETGMQENENASMPENLHAGKPENQHAGKEPDPEWGNLSIRVHKRDRLHWLIAARKSGTNLTQVITEALNARFGEAPLDAE